MKRLMKLFSTLLVIATLSIGILSRPIGVQAATYSYLVCDRYGNFLAQPTASSVDIALHNIWNYPGGYKGYVYIYTGNNTETDYGVTLFYDAGGPVYINYANGGYLLQRYASNNVNYVKAVQQQLIIDGRYTGAVDGIYGAATEAAVKAYQQWAGITADGIVGKDTYRWLCY